MGLLDLVFPKKCVNCGKIGEYVCENCFSYLSFEAKTLCLVCSNQSFNGLTHLICKKKYTINGCFSAIAYNKIAKKLISSFKSNPYLSDLKKFLSDLFIESVIQNESFIKQIEIGQWIFVPIPLYSSKLKKRGYNQSEILAKMLAKSFKFPCINILEKTKDTKNQSKLPRVERQENLKNAFKIIKNNPSIKNRNIFLVDDIVTTGSTLKEAAKILKKAGANKVFGLTLAKNQPIKNRPF